MSWRESEKSFVNLSKVEMWQQSETLNRNVLHRQCFLSNFLTLGSFATSNKLIKLKVNGTKLLDQLHLTQLHLEGAKS